MQTLIYNISKSRNDLKKHYGESCFIMDIFKIKLKFWQSSHKSSKLKGQIGRIPLLMAFATWIFLGHMSHSGDLLLWVGVRCPASSVMRRPLTSTLKIYWANLYQICYEVPVGDGCIKL